MSNPATPPPPGTDKSIPLQTRIAPTSTSSAPVGQLHQNNQIVGASPPQRPLLSSSPLISPQQQLGVPLTPPVTPPIFRAPTPLSSPTFRTSPQQLSAEPLITPLQIRATTPQSPQPSQSLIFFETRPSAAQTSAISGSSSSVGAVQTAQSQPNVTTSARQKKKGKSTSAQAATSSASTSTSDSAKATGKRKRTPNWPISDSIKLIELADEHGKAYDKILNICHQQHWLTGITSKDQLRKHLGRLLGEQSPFKDDYTIKSYTPDPQLTPAENTKRAAEFQVAEQLKKRDFDLAKARLARIDIRETPLTSEDRPSAAGISEEIETSKEERKRTKEERMVRFEKDQQEERDLRKSQIEMFAEFKGFLKESQETERQLLNVLQAFVPRRE